MASRLRPGRLGPGLLRANYKQKWTKTLQLSLPNGTTELLAPDQDPFAETVSCPSRDPPFHNAHRPMGSIWTGGLSNIPNEPCGLGLHLRIYQDWNIEPHRAGGK